MFSNSIGESLLFVVLFLSAVFALLMLLARLEQAPASRPDRLEQLMVPRGGKALPRHRSKVPQKPAR